MAFRLLLDGMTEASLAEYCRKLGHDVERVVAVPDLGPGSDDDTVIDYAERKERLLVTYDDDFLEGDAPVRIGILFQSDDRMPPLETANIVDAIDQYVDQWQIIDGDAPYHLTSDWL